MTAEPSASIWEVTRLILESPDRSPADIAHEHGYSPAEIADLVPIFLDTARTDWARHVDTGGDWTVPTGGDAVDLDAELYLRDLAGSGSIDVAGFDPDAGGGEALPPDLGELLDGPDHPDAVPLDAVPLDAVPLDADATGELAPDVPQLPFGEDDPFAGDPYDPGPYDPGPYDPDPFGHPTGLEPPDVDVDDAVDGPYLA